MTNMKSDVFTPNHVIPCKNMKKDFEEYIMSDGDEDDNQSLFEEEDFDDDIDIMLSHHTSLQRESQ